MSRKKRGRGCKVSINRSKIRWRKREKNRRRERRSGKREKRKQISNGNERGWQQNKGGRSKLRKRRR